VSEKRQKKRRNPTSKTKVGSEASDGVTRGLEALTATDETENLAELEQLMEEVLDKENLKEALTHVLQNKGAPGIDGMTVEKLPEYLKDNWRRIRKEVLEGKYAPRAVRRVEIPKATGGVRQLGIPCAVDRFIQKALQLVLQKYWDPIQLRISPWQVAAPGNQASARICKQRIAIRR
jgi:RNA-directed DNA polymerase